MKEARIYVDFNEMVEDNLVLLSKTDFKSDSEGNQIEMEEGLKVKVYSDDINDKNEVDNLIADGVVELNTYREKYGWTAAAKWNCRIDENGIQNESERKTNFG